ncbi:hypothetical protein PP756_gp55 [Pseudomonas phage VB_PaeP_VL1]|uniref:Uncharacterized protein n=1 Tax=Pseudomonas phage VB_PaeP_VL1 TaxID=2894395 RepID=A0AAE8YZ43_9CAUD|nr:hypothetical protein PP756_gp55 [Pseudomonas phage VB_PaeP_VL1]UGV19851.1 hypothetical protein vBPaePVL1_55 [Pseudomonas phage VB_PaeP_VL1]
MGKYREALNMAKNLRAKAYQEESEPIRIELEALAMENGETADLSPWLEKVKEIQERYPLPEEPK